MSLLDRIVSDVMTARPTTVRPDERLDVALALMTACRFRHLPVEDDGQVVGMVSLRDVYRVDRSHLTASRGERALHLRGIEVGLIMTQPVRTVSWDTGLLDAAADLVSYDISSLPVLRDGRLAGIITRTDYLGVASALLDSESRPHGDPVPVSRLMQACPITTVRPDDRLDLAWSVMRAERHHHLPVVLEGKLMGVLSDLDLLGVQSSTLDPLGPSERIAERHWIHVADAMSPRAVTVGPDESAAEAAQVLRRRRIGCLPVVRAGRLTGILAVTDYFYYLLSHTPERVAAVARR
jgi:CBS domain-containing protein